MDLQDHIMSQGMEILKIFFQSFQVDHGALVLIKHYTQVIATSKQDCMFSENLIKHIKSPLFLIQSFYDSYAISVILNIGCLNWISMQNCSVSQRQAIEQYRDKSLQILSQIVNDPKNSVWGIACIGHVYIQSDLFWNQNDRVPQNSQNFVSNSVEQWIEGKSTNNSHIDLQEWPNNKPCSGLA